MWTSADDWSWYSSYAETSFPGESIEQEITRRFKLFWLKTSLGFVWLQGRQSQDESEEQDVFVAALFVNVVCLNHCSGPTNNNTEESN